jgi:hypothetical protein
MTLGVAAASGVRLIVWCKESGAATEAWFRGGRCVGARNELGPLIDFHALYELVTQL